MTSPHVSISDFTRDRSDWSGVCALVRHLLIFAACATLAEFSTARSAQSAGRLLQGIVLTFLFCAAHECTHRTAFQSRTLNSAVGYVIGLLLLLPPYWFRCFHMEHHKHTQNPALDPEIRWSEISPLEERKHGPRSLRTRLWVLSGLGYWTERVATTWSYVCGSVPAADQNFVHHERMQARLIHEARLFAATYALLLAVAIAGVARPWPSFERLLAPSPTHPSKVARNLPEWCRAHTEHASSRVLQWVQVAPASSAATGSSPLSSASRFFVSTSSRSTRGVSWYTHRPRRYHVGRWPTPGRHSRRHSGTPAPRRLPSTLAPS